MRRRDGQPKQYKHVSPYGCGVAFRKRKKPYLAKVRRKYEFDLGIPKYETINLGSYATAQEARDAVAAFLLRERDGESSA